MGNITIESLNDEFYKSFEPDAPNPNKKIRLTENVSPNVGLSPKTPPLETVHQTLVAK